MRKNRIQHRCIYIKIQFVMTNIIDFYYMIRGDYDFIIALIVLILLFIEFINQSEHQKVVFMNIHIHLNE